MATAGTATGQVTDAEVPFWRAQPVVTAALAGIAGGVVFGLMMQIMMPPMIGMIGSLVGAPALGWLVHLVISAIIGAGFGVVLLAIGQRHLEWGPALALGTAYGALWWVLGPLLIMPTMMGMGPQFGNAFSESSLMSLIGHLLFGVVTGAAYKALAR